jgi:NAD(P)-dependent dehydrogenase (short-subunit alcohol dehydrogenase family)
VARLSGKVALITGGGTGIGRACAEMFAREGARVALAGRRAAPLAEAAAAIAKRGGEALAVECDVTIESEVARAVEAAVARFGRLDAVVNSAGALQWTTAENTTEQDWDRVVDTNLKGTFLVSRAALAALRRAGGGSIINIGSVMGLVAMPERAAYAAAKGGVVMLTKAMALEHAKDRIRVNCICPSVVDTETIRERMARLPDPEAARRARVARIPMGRMGAPEDVAWLAVFLAADESTWLTGAAIPLDGGESAG